jgi:acyl transferase domain-containing protein/NAD(P)-dependent dehydrogenase (short-subunit alcohol dehydrogenase family)
VPISPIPASELRAWAVAWVMRNAGIAREAVETDRPFGDYGLSSMKLVSLSGELSELLDRNLPVDIAYSFPTIAALVAELSSSAENGPAPAAPAPAEPAAATPESTAAASGGTASGSTASGSASAASPTEPAASPAGREPIAVVGAGCRLPGGIRGPEEYWRFLLDGGDAIHRTPPGRWSGLPGADRIREGAAGLGGFLDDIDRFDAAYFGISPKEAAMTDPQQRLVLEVAQEALEHAGIPARTLEGRRAGVFLGASTADYAPDSPEDMGGWSAAGSSMGVIAGRLSYSLGLRGPSMLVDTACSASLVAVHLACQSLRAGESELALAGGVNLLLSPGASVAFEEAGMLSPDGRCHTFDAGAHGYGRGEGCGVVVLKRLSDAARDGDRVLAVIRGSAVNHNGRSNGLMAPNGQAQAELLAAAYENAGLDPATVDYVEAHGTGTAVGDPIEMGAITSVTGEGRDPQRPLLVGAVKTNLGHLEAAAGVAGFLKTVLALRHGELPATLHFRALNPAIPADAPVRVVAERTPWPSGAGPRTAGVSSFGFGGSNAHVVLEQAPPGTDGGREAGPADDAHADDASASRPVVVTVDGSSPHACREQAAALHTWLAEHRDTVSAASVAHTTTVRRSHGPVRAAVVARDTGELLDRLLLLSTGEEDTGVVAGWMRDDARPVFVFSGQGAQWPGMATELLTEDAAFAGAIDALDPLVREESGFSVREVLAEGAATALDPTDVMQPVLFSVHVALAASLRARGVEPAAVVGHSMGEVAAAVVSGALSLEDGVRVTCRRSRLMKGLSGRGAMAVVSADPEEVTRFVAGHGLDRDVTVAIRLSPSATVVSGDRDAVELLMAAWQAEGVKALPVNIDVACHSPQVDEILDELAAQLADIRPRTPRVPLYSTVTPGRATPMDARYWVDNLRQPVLLSDAVRLAARDGHEVFVEVSPHPVLVGPIGATLRSLDIAEAVVRPTLRREEHPLDALALTAAALHCHGHPIAWNTVWHTGTLLPLPPRSWDHRRSHWLSAGTTPTGTPLPTTGQEGRGTPVADHEEPGTPRATAPEQDSAGAEATEAGAPTADAAGTAATRGDARKAALPAAYAEQGIPEEDADAFAGVGRAPSLAGRGRRRPVAARHDGHGSPAERVTTAARDTAKPVPPSPGAPAHPSSGAPAHASPGITAAASAVAARPPAPAAPEAATPTPDAVDPAAARTTTGPVPRPTDTPTPPTHPGAAPSTPSRTDLEVLVRDEVAAVMECEPEDVRTRQSLFAAGMDSLMSLVVLGRLSDLLGLEVTPADLREHPTVASLAAFLADALPQGPLPAAPRERAERPAQTRTERTEGAPVTRRTPHRTRPRDRAEGDRSMSRVALVTGGNRGIGLAVARRLAADGMKVAVTYRSDPPSDLFAVQCDVRDPESVHHAVNEVQQTLGGIDVLVANSGITRDRAFAVMSEPDFAAVMDTNLMGAYRVTRAVVREMMRKRAGRIVFVSSVAGLTGSVGQANYASSKAGMIGLARSLALELSPYGVTVNTVAPGWVDTDMTVRLPEKVKEGIKSQVPLGRQGSAEEIAEVVGFLASEGSSYVTGAVLPVDGGLSLGA